jgi:hypothetical protein
MAISPTSDSSSAPPPHARAGPPARVGGWFRQASAGCANTAVLKVCAEVCLRCGERLYSQETVRRFEQIRAKLERHETEEFRTIGVSYQVA